MARARRPVLSLGALASCGRIRLFGLDCSARIGGLAAKMPALPGDFVRTAVTLGLMFSLKGRTAFITGAGSGIGEAIAEAFAQAGARVIVADLNEAAGKTVAERLTATGGAVEFIRLDVTKDADFAEAVRQYPVMDIVVANAGIGHVGTILTTKMADLDRVMEVNVRGVFRTMQAWLPGMVERKRGVLLNLCSTAGLGGLVDRFAYSTSKHAVLGLTRNAALDLARTGVRVNCLCPARVETPWVAQMLTKYPDEAAARREMAATQAVGRMGTPTEIAAAALFLVSDEAAFITGVALPVDGGWTAGMFPRAANSAT